MPLQKPRLVRALGRLKTRLSWLINSMEPRIGRKYLFYHTAKEIWDAVQEIYSDLKNINVDCQNSKTPTAPMAQTCTISHAFLSKSHQPNCWIMDTGASDHMIESMEFFDDYTKYHNRTNAWVEDGKPSPAVG